VDLLIKKSKLKFALFYLKFDLSNLRVDGLLVPIIEETPKGNL
jgi:hypothetical protein